MTEGSIGARSLGAVPTGDGRCGLLLWAPHLESVAVVLEGSGRISPLEPRPDGYHHAVVEAAPGDRYRYVLPDGRRLPDPASRWQPEGVPGPSAVFDPGAHRWRDAGFRAPALADLVIYELHVGTFTAPGTLAAAADALDHVAELGATAVEVMPLAQFPGRRNWGYDGVFPFAVQDSYGGPAALQQFVDSAHELGLAVVLDVVYNHLGPEGNVLPVYGPYTTDRYRTPWGEAVNVDGPGSDEVRRYFVENACMWLADFHVDALRLDAVHGIVDTTAHPFLAELSESVAALGQESGRNLLLVAESSDNDPAVVTPVAQGGLGMDAQWNDDFHHALHVALTGERFGYYADYSGLDHLARAYSEGFVLRGEHSRYRGRRHGASSAHLGTDRFVVFAQNHDQVGNRPAGDRLGTGLDLGRTRLAAAALLLSPYVPLLFMGEEYDEDAPFPYFVDHAGDELLEAVRRGRAAEMAALDAPGEALDPADPATFEAAVVDRSLVGKGDHARVWATYRGLLAARRAHGALRHWPRRETVAAAGSDGILAVVRTGTEESVVLLCNFSDGTVAGRVLDAPGPWRKLVDSTAPDLGGEGEPLPDELPAGGGVTLGPFGFCVYAAGVEG